MFKFIPAAFLTLSLSLSCLGIRPSLPAKPKPTPAAKPTSLQVMAFFENGWGGIYGDSLPAFLNHARQLDLLSPVWFTITNTGTIKTRDRAEVIAQAEQHRTRLVPLVNYRGEPTAPFLNQPQARRTSLEQLQALSAPYPGLVLDVEYLPIQYRDSLTRYVSDLAVLLRKKKKQLWVCIFPQADFPEKISGLHDYQDLAKAADGLILMAYDQHRSTTEPGPIAALDWVEKNLVYALKYIKPEQLWLGLSTYGYRWNHKTAKAIAIPAWYAWENGAKHSALQWHNTWKVPYFELEPPASDASTATWFEDGRSAGYKLELARRHHLKGIAFWRLGYETEDFWENFQGD